MWWESSLALIFMQYLPKAIWYLTPNIISLRKYYLVNVKLNLLLDNVVGRPLISRFVKWILVFHFKLILKKQFCCQCITTSRHYPLGIRKVKPHEKTDFLLQVEDWLWRGRFRMKYDVRSKGEYLWVCCNKRIESRIGLFLGHDQMTQAEEWMI